MKDISYIRGLTLRDLERQYCRAAIKYHGGDIAIAAAALGIPEQIFRERLVVLGIVILSRPKLRLAPESDSGL